MVTARKAPLGHTWRPSTLPHLRRVLILQRDLDGHVIGSIGPEGAGRWMDRDTGEVFSTRDDAQINVEKFL
jgi:hypothetical protein